jgi:putative flippase GtrA
MATPSPAFLETDLGKSLKAYLFSTASLYLLQLTTYLNGHQDLFAGYLGEYGWLSPLIASLAAVVVNFVYHRYFNQATPSFTEYEPK